MHVSFLMSNNIIIRCWDKRLKADKYLKYRKVSNPEFLFRFLISKGFDLRVAFFYDAKSRKYLHHKTF